MQRLTMILPTLFATAALAATSVPLPDRGFCTTNPGLNRSSVVCDYALQGKLRVRVLLDLNARGNLRCSTVDVYDETIGSIRDGRIVSTETRCF